MYDRPVLPARIFRRQRRPHPARGPDRARPTPSAHRPGARTRRETHVEHGARNLATRRQRDLPPPSRSARRAGRPRLLELGPRPPPRTVGTASKRFFPAPIAAKMVTTAARTSIALSWASASRAAWSPPSSFPMHPTPPATPCSTASPIRRSAGVCSRSAIPRSTPQASLPTVSTSSSAARERLRSLWTKRRIGFNHGAARGSERIRAAHVNPGTLAVIANCHRNSRRDQIGNASVVIRSTVCDSLRRGA